MLPSRTAESEIKVAAHNVMAADRVRLQFQLEREPPRHEILEPPHATHAGQTCNRTARAKAPKFRIRRIYGAISAITGSNPNGNFCTRCTPMHPDAPDAPDPLPFVPAAGEEHWWSDGTLSDNGASLI
jgi:hypothetical protein